MLSIFGPPFGFVQLVLESKCLKNDVLRHYEYHSFSRRFCAGLRAKKLENFCFQEAF
jgi:hypothetical protein